MLARTVRQCSKYCCTALIIIFLCLQIEPEKRNAKSQSRAKPVFFSPHQWKWNLNGHTNIWCLKSVNEISFFDKLKIGIEKSEQLDLDWALNQGHRVLASICTCTRRHSSRLLGNTSSNQGPWVLKSLNQHKTYR